MTGPRWEEDPYRCRSCRNLVGNGHLDTCELLAARVNRVAAYRAFLFGGTFQNHELVLSGLDVRAGLT